MYIDNLVEVAKRELSWEVDYTREAECTRTFKKLLEPYPDYYVPDVIGMIFLRSAENCCSGSMCNNCLGKGGVLPQKL